MFKQFKSLLWFIFSRVYNDSCLELPNHLPWNKPQSKLINVVYQPLKVARVKEEKTFSFFPEQ